MATARLYVKIKVAWWFRVYAYGVVFLAEVFGLQPDPEKVNFWVKKAIKKHLVVVRENADQ